MRAAAITIILLLFSAFIPYLYAQEMTVVPNGVLEKSDRAEVTGDYVRVRTGPSLKNKILTKVNRGTQVRILDRDKTIAEISEAKNYWYHIKLDKSGIEGWIWGQYLRKIEVVPQKVAKPPVEQTDTTIRKTVQPELSFLDSGIISQTKSLVTSGDLNNNGIKEIIFLNRENRKSYWNLSGYEETPAASAEENAGTSFAKVYSGKLRSADVLSIAVFKQETSGVSFIVLNGALFSYIYSLDPEKKTFYLASKINSPIVTAGRLEGQKDYLVFIKKSRSTDSDGTVTYEIQAASYESMRGRIRMRGRIEYKNPLPIKKMLAYDLDGDGFDEIICEIGGGEFGGGITVLKIKDGTLKKILNTGISTYKNNPFINMWGKNINGNPTLLLYSTDPETKNDVDTSMGFLSAGLSRNHLTVERFIPISKMLDDVNNDRVVLAYTTDIEDMPFILLDYDEKSKQYSIKKPVLQ